MQIFHDIYHILTYQIKATCMGTIDVDTTGGSRKHIMYDLSEVSL